ncbi:MAG: DUF882 domain-containing protein [Hyphomicrobiales bacterium]|nr:DUF882 domain-containing protein [Hyphomicrobiales bacterium]
MKISTFFQIWKWTSAAVAAGLVLGAFGAANAEERHLELFSVNTKEKIAITYKRDGKFIPEALKKLNHFMRDWRRDVSTKMDPKLFDVIWEIHRELGSKKPIHLISGYRSPKTNAMLRKTKGGQAKKSRHMTGQASDIHFPDVSVKELRNSALIREQGGVGYYPTSAIPFVHVDTGRVRHWPRLPRRELAILFPDGKSKHVPSDGKPLTKKDFNVALAALKKNGGALPIAVRSKLEGTPKGQIAIASLQSDPIDPPVPTPAPATQGVQPGVVLASLSPSDKIVDALTKRKPEDTPAPIVQAGLTPDKAKLDPALSDTDLTPAAKPKKPSANIPQDQMSSAPQYDDDHPDELYYHPIPILPFLTDTPAAEIDMVGTGEIIGLPNAHTLFGEARQMLVNEFEPGLQYAKLYWSRQFRGTAVNTQLKRLVRDIPEEPAPVIASTPASEDEEKPTRTAQK